LNDSDEDDPPALSVEHDEELAFDIEKV